MDRSIAALLYNFAADLIAVSPKESFTRDEMEHWLRTMPDEIEHQFSIMQEEQQSGVPVN
jgi:hypothetical protein